LLALLLGAQGWSGRLITRMASTQDAVSMPSQASFVQTEMRAAAMKLHTREQAPKEGAAEAKPRENTRDPTVLDYAQFLLDSKEVYQAFEEVCGSVGALEKFRGTGLERVEPLEKDLKVLAADFDAGVADLEVLDSQQLFALEGWRLASCGAFQSDTGALGRSRNMERNTRRSCGSWARS